jgi:hypothetical protein
MADPSPEPASKPPTADLANYLNEARSIPPLPELANKLGFAMIGNAEARMGGGREEFTPPPTLGLRAEVSPCVSLSEADVEGASSQGADVRLRPSQPSSTLGCAPTPMTPFATI